MTSTTAVIVATIGTAGWTISIIAILIALAIAWRVFSGKEDLDRLRRRRPRRGSSS